MFHFRRGRYGRAFHKPPVSICQFIIMWRRGWRKFNDTWWGLPSKNQKQLEELMMEQSTRGRR